MAGKYTLRMRKKLCDKISLDIRNSKGLLFSKPQIKVKLVGEGDRSMTWILGKKFLVKNESFCAGDVILSHLLVDSLKQCSVCPLVAMMTLCSSCLLVARGYKTNSIFNR